MKRPLAACPSRLRDSIAAPRVVMEFQSVTDDAAGSPTGSKRPIEHTKRRDRVPYAGSKL
jgi:hypothetical protein